MIFVVTFVVFMLWIGVGCGGYALGYRHGRQDGAVDERARIHQRAAAARKRRAAEISQARHEKIAAEWEKITAETGPGPESHPYPRMDPWEAKHALRLVTGPQDVIS